MPGENGLLACVFEGGVWTTDNHYTAMAHDKVVFDHKAAAGRVKTVAVY